MPLETATNIYQLVPANPPDTDLVQQGDDHLRLIKSVIQQTWPNLTGPNLPTSTGTANAQIVAHVYGPASYSAGQMVTFKAGFSNTGPATINVNGAGVASILSAAGVPLIGGELVTGAIYTLVYDPSGPGFKIVGGTAYLSPAAFNNVGRNLLHNGEFTVLQRGQGPFAGGVYSADRWSSYVSLDTFSAQIITLADVDRTQIGDEAARFALQAIITGNAGAAAGSQINQALEGVRRTSGKTITVSFWAKAAAGTPSIGLQPSQNFGSGGSPSAQINVAPATIPITTTWTRYSAVFVMPSVAGKILGTNGDDKVFLSFWTSAGANFAGQAGIGVQSGTFSFWGVQLEIGSVMTPFEKVDPADQLARCQRFYQIFYTVVSYPFNPSTAGWGAQWIVPLVSSMRATPSAVISNPVYTNATNLRFIQGSISWLQFAADSVSTSGGFSAAGTITASADL